MDFLNLFHEKKPVIGMIHLKGDSDKDVYERMKKEIDIYVNHGIDGIIIENYFGNYYQLEQALQYVNQLSLNIPVGVNCLNFDSMGFDLAKKYHMDFIQCDSVVGHVKARDEYTLDAFFKKYKTDKIAIIGGVRFKYQPLLSTNSLEHDLKIATQRCDAIAVTGDATGEETDDQKIIEFRGILEKFPLVVAAGVTVENIERKLQHCDAVIVGSYFKDNYQDNGELCADHIDELMGKVRKIRKEV